MHFQKFLLDKIDDVQMQLRNIDTVKLDYNSSKLKFVVNPREKSVNHLSMYGSPMLPAETMAKPSLKLTKKVKEIKTKAVSGIFRVFSFEFF